MVKVTNVTEKTKLQIKAGMLLKGIYSKNYYFVGRECNTDKLYLVNLSDGVIYQNAAFDDVEIIPNGTKIELEQQ